MAAPTILIIEDDPGNRDVLCAVLRGEGYKCVAVGNGDAALAKIARRVPDLIVLDYRIPGIGGPALAEELRRRGARPPILLVTAAGDAEELAREMGAAGWLSKPFELEDLLAEVARLCGSRA